MEKETNNNNNSLTLYQLGVRFATLQTLVTQRKQLHNRSNPATQGIFQLKTIENTTHKIFKKNNEKQRDKEAERQREEEITRKKCSMNYKPIYIAKYKLKRKKTCNMMFRGKI